MIKFSSASHPVCVMFYLVVGALMGNGFTKMILYCKSWW